MTDKSGRVGNADQALVASGEAASHLHPSGFDPSRCRNCDGEQWVCEHHQDTPWESSGHAAKCGASAPCPVCNREMACAPYTPHWWAMPSAPKDGREILISGGTFNDDGDWPECDYAFGGCAIVRFVDGAWQGEGRHAHDAYRWHKPARWMPVPAIVDGSPEGRDAQQLDGEAATARASSEPDTGGG